MESGDLRDGRLHYRLGRLGWRGRRRAAGAGLAWFPAIKLCRVILFADPFVAAFLALVFDAIGRRFIGDPPAATLGTEGHFARHGTTVKEVRRFVTENVLSKRQEASV